MKLTALEALRAKIDESMHSSPSPVGRWLNGTLRVVEEGSLTIEFVVREDMTNPVGILHGGIAAAMMDEVLGITVYSLGHENFYTTVNLHIDYLSSARMGETVRVQSHIIRKGRNIVHADCRMTNPEGKLLAKATTNMLETTIRRP